jgi:nitrite reductase (NO-forming)
MTTRKVAEEKGFMSESRKAAVTRTASLLDNLLVRNISLLKTSMRILFGIIWGIDGALKFQPGLVGAFPSMMEAVVTGQPTFLKGWFSFWSSLTLSNPAMFVQMQGIFELTLSLALILGLLRKVAYVGGFFLSLLIWAVPEGFGGPYGPTSTDIGTGIIYALGFLFLILVNATFGPSRLSLDWLIERKWPSWRKIAEVRSA